MTTLVPVPAWLADSGLEPGPYAGDGDTGPASGMANSAVVIHTAECPEIDQAAENVSGWGSREQIWASWDIMVDNNSALYCCPYPRTSWAAPGTNGWAYQIEHAGYASQSAGQWADAYSSAVLKRSARIVGTICARNPDGRIPVRRLTHTDLVAGRIWGIFGHNDATLAYGGSHTDPGPNFPWSQYLAMVQGRVNEIDGIVPNYSENTLVQNFVQKEHSMTMTSPFVLHKSDSSATVYAAAPNGAWRAFNNEDQFKAFLENLGQNPRKDGVDWSQVAVSSEDDVYLFHQWLDGLWENQHNI